MFTSTQNLCRSFTGLHVTGSRAHSSNRSRDNAPDTRGGADDPQPGRGSADFLQSLHRATALTDPSKIPMDSPLRYEGLGVRIDKRSPEEMREVHKAFKGRGKLLDIRAHVKGGICNGNTGLVSFSRTVEGTRHLYKLFKTENYFFNPGADLYLYGVKLHRHNSYHAHQFSPLDEDEVVTEKASLREVEWVQIRHALGGPPSTIRRPFTPSSDLPVDRFGASLSLQEMPLRPPGDPDAGPRL